jgi:uncharacterized oxidoreductase
MTPVSDESVRMNETMAHDSDLRLIPAPAIADWVAQVFVAAGCAADEARRIADGLVQANLFGHDSHGVGLVPQYLGNIRLGLARPGQTVRVLADHGALVSVDGQRGFGQTIGPQAMAIALERVRTHGVCVLGTANTHHLARIGQWGELCAEAGCASIHFVNVQSLPLVAPWGGSDARLANNPFCVAVPHEPHPIVLDYATSAVAFGKVRVAAEAGAAMAPGILLDRDGQATTDPGVMLQTPLGAILPFAQHKGFALAVMCELLGGALSGGHVQDHVPTPNPMRNNMLSVVFAPDRLVSREALAAQVASMAAYLRGSPLQPGATGIHLPGEPERITARERQRAGIPMARRTCEMLAAAGREVGVAEGILAAGAAR